MVGDKAGIKMGMDMENGPDHVGFKRLFTRKAARPLCQDQGRGRANNPQPGIWALRLIF
jgi:hypothetical protein